MGPTFATIDGATSLDETHPQARRQPPTTYTNCEDVIPPEVWSGHLLCGTRSAVGSLTSDELYL